MTLESFLAWEERQELRYEFDGFRPVAMTGGTYAHAQIQFRLAHALIARLDGTRCRAVGSELKVQTATGVRYPDAFVVCSPIPLNATIAHDPVVIFEILSPSAANDDLGAKKAEYQALPSVQSYIVLQQTHRSAQVFPPRRGDDRRRREIRRVDLRVRRRAGGHDRDARNRRHATARGNLRRHPARERPADAVASNGGRDAARKPSG